MFCEECGNRLDDDAAFCPQCGHKVAGFVAIEEGRADSKEAGKAAAEPSKAAKPKAEEKAEKKPAEEPEEKSVETPEGDFAEKSEKTAEKEASSSDGQTLTGAVTHVLVTEEGDDALTASDAAGAFEFQETEVLEAAKPVEVAKAAKAAESVDSAVTADQPKGDPGSTLAFTPEELSLDEMRAIESLDRDPFEPAPMSAYGPRAAVTTASLPVISDSTPFMEMPRQKESNVTTIIVAVVAVVVVIAVGIAAVFAIMGSPSETSDDAAPAQQIEGSADTPAAQEQDAPVTEPEAEPAATEPEMADEPAEEPEESEEPALEETEWVLPESNLRYYTENELASLSDEELYFARNEIYARLGREFKNDDLRAYFGSKAWYTPQYAPEDFDRMGPALNEYERANANTIMELERMRGSKYVN